jgi:hypothetical protein
MELVANGFDRGLEGYSVCEWDIFPTDGRAYEIETEHQRVDPVALCYELETPTSAPTRFEYVFSSLAEKWITETGRSSLVGKRYSHEAYLALLEFGRLNRNQAISAILKELKKRPDRWFDALRTLAQENPARDAATFDESVHRWLEWGVENGYLA